MKNRSVNILIVALLLLALMSVMILVFLKKAHDDFPNDITVFRIPQEKPAGFPAGF